MPDLEFTGELLHTYAPADKTWTARLALRLTFESRVFLREVPDKLWRTLCLVMLRMQPDGRCVISEDQLAEDMGNQ